MKIEQCPIDSDEKQQMVARAAYFRFADRGFIASDPVQDWLAAETEIDQAIGDNCRLPQQKRLVDTQRWGLVETLSGWWHRFSHWPNG